jgi:site-specific recombinase XerD
MNISLSDAIEGYLLAANARHLSPHTLADYNNTFRKFQTFLDDDLPIEDITSQHVESFLAIQTVSNKTISNYHIGLSALWTWAVKANITPKHIVRKVQRAKPQKKDIIPYSEKDIRAMLNMLNKSRPYTRPGKRSSTHKLLHADRNRAIILLLLDTGIRASELSNLKIHQVDLKSQQITVWGKGSKERTIPFSSQTGQALWKYLATRQKDTLGDHLFITKKGGALPPDQLLRCLRTIGQRAGIHGVSCHRFRHTFAIQFLRNHGNIYALKRLLGHTTLAMTERYLAIAQADIHNAHRQASPVANWHL